MVIILSDSLDLWELASAVFLCRKHEQRVILFSWLSDRPALKQLSPDEKLYVVGHFEADRLYTRDDQGITVDDFATALQKAELPQVAKIVLVACNTATAVIEGLTPFKYAPFPQVLKEAITLKCKVTVPVTGYMAEVNVTPGGGRFVWREQDKSGQSNVTIETPPSQEGLQKYLDGLTTPANEEQLGTVMAKLQVLPEWKVYCEEIARDFARLEEDRLLIPKAKKAERKQTF
jgi:hypothetical protein